jgi:hypothetical protein
VSAATAPAVIDDATATMMRECEQHITALDDEIKERQAQLRDMKRVREGAVARLRSYVRGERALPLEAEDDEPETALAYAERRLREVRR